MDRYGSFGDMTPMTGGEWVRYSDHCEAMKLIAAHPAGEAQEPVAWSANWIRDRIADVVESWPYNEWSNRITAEQIRRIEIAAPAPIASPAALSDALSLREYAEHCIKGDVVARVMPEKIIAMLDRIRDLDRACDSMASTIENMDKAVRETLGIDPDADDALPNLVADWMEGRAQQSAVQDGYVLLPVEPTPELIEVIRSTGSVSRERARRFYRSWLAAAPATQHTEKG